MTHLYAHDLTSNPVPGHNHTGSTHSAKWTRDDPILQADWLASQSGYADVNDLYQSDPDLFVALAAEWRDEASPWTGLGD